MKQARPHILFSLMVIMLASLFFSRALLAISMTAFVFFSFLHRDAGKQFRSFFSEPLLWGMSLLFFFPLLSGFWSEDKHQWLELIKTKATLLLLPFAFSYPLGVTLRRWRLLAYGFVVLIVGLCCYTLVHYSNNIDAVNQSYLQGRALVTPLANDHVRFSWLVFAAILFSGWLFYSERRKKHAWIIILPAVLLIIYLHLLAARTGLISLYIGLFFLASWLLFRANLKIAMLTIAVLLLAPITAFFLFPSFKNKLLYFNHEWNYFKEAHYLPHSNDAVRVISIRAGWHIMLEHPAAGVGYGDLLKETNEWYDEHYPGMEPNDKIFPSSQYILSGAGMGIFGLAVFVFVMMLPFFIAMPYRLPWWMLNATLAFSLLFDIGLEVQFGVFIYSFFVLWCWQWLKQQKMASL
jgi:hypothetical protein